MRTNTPAPSFRTTRISGVYIRSRIGHGQDALLTAVIGCSMTNVLCARSTAMAPCGGAVAVGSSAAGVSHLFGHAAGGFEQKLGGGVDFVTEALDRAANAHRRDRAAVEAEHRGSYRAGT